MTLNDLTSFDCIIAIILAGFLLRGFCIGFIRQTVAIVALAGSYWLAGEYIGEVIPHVQDIVERPGAVFLISFGSLSLVFTMLFAMIGHLLRRMLQVKLIGWSNRFAGGLLGLVRGGLVAVLLHMILASALSPSHHLFQNSLAAPYLGKSAEIIRPFIRDGKAREDLKPKAPLSAPKEKKNGGKKEPAAEKVLPVTIPDVEVIPSAPEQEEQAVIIPAGN